MQAVACRRDSSVKRPNMSGLAPLKILVALLFLINLVTLPSFAWQNDEESASAQTQQGYPVIVDGYEVFRVRQNLGAASAEERAQRISAALEDLAKAQDFNPEKLKSTEEGGVATVRYGDQLIVTINDAEAKSTGLPRHALAYQYSKLLQEKLAQAREQHTPHYLWRAAAYAATTILACGLLIWLVIVGARRIVRALETSAAARIRGIKIQQSEIVQGARLTALLISLTKLLRIAVIAVLA